MDKVTITGDPDSTLTTLTTGTGNGTGTPSPPVEGTLTKPTEEKIAGETSSITLTGTGTGTRLPVESTEEKSLLEDSDDEETEERLIDKRRGRPSSNTVDPPRSRSLTSPRDGSIDLQNRGDPPLSPPLSRDSGKEELTGDSSPRHDISTEDKEDSGIISTKEDSPGGSSDLPKVATQGNTSRDSDEEERSGDSSPRHHISAEDDSPSLTAVACFYRILAFLCCFWSSGAALPPAPEENLRSSLLTTDDESVRDTTTDSIGFFSRIFSLLRWSPRQPVLPVSAPAPAPTEAAPPTGEGWTDFVKEANDIIQWVLSSVFLFVPASKLVETILVKGLRGEDLVSAMKNGIFPEVFIPLVFLYAGFYLGAWLFVNRKTKGFFQAVSLVIGGCAALVALYVVGSNTWWVSLVVVGCFVILLGCAKLHERGCSCGR